jgi:hypothetical protein
MYVLYLCHQNPGSVKTFNFLISTFLKLVPPPIVRILSSKQGQKMSLVTNSCAPPSMSYEYLLTDDESHRKKRKVGQKDYGCGTATERE